MKTIFENEFIRVSETGRDYDFVATIENKTNKALSLVFHDLEEAEENAITEQYNIPANDWIGLTNWEYEGNNKQALEQGDYIISAE